MERPPAAPEVSSVIEAAHAVVQRPTWSVVADPVTTDRRRAWEAMMTVSDGSFGTRGLGHHFGSPSWPAVVAAGVYDDAAVPALLGGPLWAAVDLEPDDGWSETARLDLHDAVLTSVYTRPGEGAVVTCTRFASAVRRGVVALRVEGPTEHIVASRILQPPQSITGARESTAIVTGTGSNDVEEMHVTCPTGAISAHGRQWITDTDGRRSLTRLASYRTAAENAPPDMGAARSTLDDAAAVGFDGLLAEHRSTWHRRWEWARTDIDGRPDLDEAMKFAEYHLLASANEHDDETAIGARGLTGPTYGGHVFWDTEVFVIPALAAMSPGAARAALAYRANRLDAARAEARRRGYAGARFPWESAADGRDVTPTEGIDLHGQHVQIHTGEREEHIVADVAWAVVRYFEWTGDRGFMERIGGSLLVETARYWASRLEVDADGSAHLRNVIGPDEYHQRVDDNAFTNVMARYNLRVAADHGAALGLGTADERREWRELSERIVDGLDPDTGVYEQFEGFHLLAPTLVSGVGVPPLNADVILGSETTERSQIIKQPDVLMLHHMVPAEVAPGSLGANLDVYIPRIAHGSSLSPAICAGLLARAERFAEATWLFELAARLDLDPETGATTMGGVHLATMGGVWQALTHGFLGVQLTPSGLTLDPQLPVEWGTVRHRVQYRRTPITIEVQGDVTRVTAARAVEVGLGDGHDTANRRTHEFRRGPQGWERR